MTLKKFKIMKRKIPENKRSLNSWMKVNKENRKASRKNKKKKRVNSLFKKKPNYLRVVKKKMKECPYLRTHWKSW